MEKKDFIEKLQTLTSIEDVLSVSRDVNELRTQFEDFCLEEDRKKQVALLEAQANGEQVDFINEPDAEKQEFYAIYSEYKEKRNKIVSEQKLEQETNLRKKKHLIERLKELIANEEHIGTAVNTYKEIHEAWKEVGEIAREKRQDIQSEYSKLLESFFFNLKIYRELKDHDFKRNLQLKQEIIEKVEKLHSLEIVKELENQIKVLQNEFDEVGPVARELWEEVKERYWTAVKAVYKKIGDFYESKKEAQRVNLEKKQALVAGAESLLNQVNDLQSTKDWETATQTLLGLQETWKTVGIGPKKENEEVWALFRSVCDSFFEKKRAFYQVIREKFDGVAEKKEAIIAKLEELKDNTDWKTTTDKVIRLQEDWKKLGSAGQRNEQKLWKEFRTLCDAFFENKKRHFEQEDVENAKNLDLKKALVAEIEAYVVGDDKQQVIQDLKEFAAKFNAIGKVPFKEKDAIYHSYKKAIDAHYTKIKLEGEEKEKVLFEAHLDTLKANPNASKLIERERRDLEQQISKQQQDITQLENNLGFISRSKAGDALRKDVEVKINSAKNRIKEMKTKIKLLTINE
jgi:hypothetical protein